MAFGRTIDILYLLTY